jgi:hypothetical protein
MNAVLQCCISSPTAIDNNYRIMPATTSCAKKTKINYKLLPIKAHYFFFMAGK